MRIDHFHSDFSSEREKKTKKEKTVTGKQTRTNIWKQGQTAAAAGCVKQCKSKHIMRVNVPNTLM